MAKKIERMIFCAKCDKEMQEIVLPRYEYEDFYVLHHINAYNCNNCGKIFFTESQAKQMKAKTEQLKKHSFGFERKITISGKSLVVTIPIELASHLHIAQGQKVKLYPIANEGLMIRKM
ncbi:AbrB/MazE/SpoVT family DNA-binding domain-containing protein [Candidatus Woesearchaeota archaeon]|nr:AbrB/MazE/SpoVT family DNA-binding domain-containing protein [Candidatus Woesearchaeota archaeon]